MSSDWSVVLAWRQPAKATLQAELNGGKGPVLLGPCAGAAQRNRAQLLGSALASLLGVGAVPAKGQLAAVTSGMDG